MGDVLEGDRYLSLLGKRLHAAAYSPPFSRNQPTSSDAERNSGASGRRSCNSVRSLARSCAASGEALRRKVRKLSHHPSNEQLHRIRIRSKHLRYAAEAATPAIGKSARRTAQKAEHLQNILGKHHDAVAAESWLTAHGSDQHLSWPVLSPGSSSPTSSESKRNTHTSGDQRGANCRESGPPAGSGDASRPISPDSAPICSARHLDGSLFDRDVIWSFVRSDSPPRWMTQSAQPTSIR